MLAGVIMPDEGVDVPESPPQHTDEHIEDEASDEVLGTTKPWVANPFVRA